MMIGTPHVHSSHTTLNFGARPRARFTSAQYRHHAKRRDARLGIVACLVFCTAFWGGLAATLIG